MDSNPLVPEVSPAQQIATLTGELRRTRRSNLFLRLFLITFAISFSVIQITSTVTLRKSTAAMRTMEKAQQQLLLTVQAQGKTVKLLGTFSGGLRVILRSYGFDCVAAANGSPKCTTISATNKNSFPAMPRNRDDIVIVYHPPSDKVASYEDMDRLFLSGSNLEYIGAVQF